MKKNRMMLVGLVAALGLIASACQIDVERNADGSLQVEAIITEADIATELGFAENPDFETLGIDLRDGYALFDATGPNDDDPSQTDEVSFRMELSVVDGHLGATVSDAVWNGIDVPQLFIDEWNEEIARDLERSAKKDKDSTLVDVEITDDQVRFEFRVDDGKRNNGNGNG
jgi:hypothetical protein